MVPLKLQIKNFLSYGNQLQTIDFEPYHLIALTGKNGHGKSALLDAMTWALWGQARKITGAAKADSHLLRLGQTHMMVIFDFECNKQRYRIKREFAQTYGKPHASVEVGIYNHDSDSFTALTTKTIRGTQEHIESMIGITYDSFINSAFLRQGHANEFSKKTPKERKEILASMLNLEIYESLRKIAAERSKQAAISLQTLTAVQDHIAKDLEQLPTIKQHIAEIQNNLILLFEREKNVKNDLSQLISEKNLLNEERQQLSILTFQYEQCLSQEREQQNILKTVHQEWRDVNRHKKQLAQIQHLDKEREMLLGQLAEKQSLIQKHLNHKEQYLQLKEREHILAKNFYAEYQTQVQQQQRLIDLSTIETTQKERFKDDIQKQITELEIQQHQIIAQYAQINHSLSLVDDDHAIIIVEKQFEKRKAFYQRWITQANVLHSELKNLEQKKQLTFDEHNPSCPLCEQNLSASRKKFLKTKYTKQDHFIQHRLNRLSSLISQLKKVLIDQHAHLEELKKNQDTKKQLLTARQNLEQKQKEIIEKHSELQHKLQMIIAELKQLQESSFAQQSKLIQVQQHEQSAFLQDPEIKKIHESLVYYEAEIQKTAQSNQEYLLIKQQIEQLDQLRQSYNRLEDQINLQNDRKIKIHELCCSLKTIKQSKIQLHNAIQKVQESLTKLTHLEQEQQKCEQIVAAFQQEKEALLESKGSLEQQHKKLEQLEKEYAEHQRNTMLLQTTIDDYALLTTVFGKDGVQALLIEDIIPEIEHEANSLLAQLTDGQSHISIESLRDLKKGGSKETLDIKISDPAGIRPYELFSGGEAFRIDFALRIAIAKLLARRAGTALQTLIIDEGFGSQDDEGLGHMMDAIYRIQDNFCKIIIVSHLPSMRDQFPVHFHVEKGPQGSSIKVIEQG